MPVAQFPLTGAGICGVIKELTLAAKNDDTRRFHSRHKFFQKCAHVLLKV